MKSLYRTLLQITCFSIFFNQLKGFKIIRSIWTQCSTSNSYSVNGKTFSITIEILSQRRSDLIGLISEEISPILIEHSLIVGVTALLSTTILIGTCYLIQYLLRNGVEILSSMSIWHTTFSSIIVRVYHLQITTINVLWTTSILEFNDGLNQSQVTVENDSLVLRISLTLNRRIYHYSNELRSPKVRDFEEYLVSNGHFCGFRNVFLKT